MTYLEFRELRAFVTNVTAKTSASWVATWNEDGPEPDVRLLRVDPVTCAHRGMPMRADEIMRIPASVALDEAKRLVIERLANA